MGETTVTLSGSQWPVACCCADQQITQAFLPTSLTQTLKYIHK